MSAFWGNLAGAITLILMLTFIGVWIWVWNRRHKAKYDALARLPMKDANAGPEIPAQPDTDDGKDEEKDGA